MRLRVPFSIQGIDATLHEHATRRSFLTEDKALAPHSQQTASPAVPVRTIGTSPIRKEGRLKVLGESQYVDDIRTEQHCARSHQVDPVPARYPVGRVHHCHRRRYSR